MMRQPVLRWLRPVLAVLPLCARGDAKYYRYSDDRQLYYTRENRIYRYSDDRQLYYIRDNKIYRYSDDRQILYYRGEDFKLTVFMVLMLADM